MNPSVPPSVVFDDALVRRFAEASGDVNPLHVDATYSRTTPHGRPVVHGALGAIAALAALEPGWLSAAADIRIRFRQAIFPGMPCSVRVEEHGETAEITLRFGGMELMSVAVTPQDQGTGKHKSSKGQPPVWKIQNHTDSLAAAPRLLNHDDMAVLGAEAGSYRPDHEGLRRLCDDLGGMNIPGQLATALAWASYWTGMHTPGRDALLTGLKLRVRPGQGKDEERLALRYAVGRPEFDRRTGSCVIEAQLDNAAGDSEITIDSILRRPVPQVTQRSVERYLKPSNKLRERKVMVVGGTRGLGRGIALALVQQGAEVFVVHRAHSQEHLEEMREDLGSEGDRLVSLCCDATDGGELTEALAAVPALDGLVLAPTPAIQSLPLSLAATSSALNYVQQSLQLAWTPLAAGTERLRDGGSLVMLSSAAVEAPPGLWPHYVAAKTALEGLAQYCAGQGRWRVTIARPPRLWTELTNSATGRIGTVPTEYVAARIVERIVDDVSDRCLKAELGQAAVLTASQLSDRVN